MNGRDPFPELVARAIRPDDAERLRALFSRLSPDTVYRRFFSPVRAPSDGALRHLAEVDHRDREALVALDDDAIVAVARWDMTAPAGEEAELAVVVADAWQGRGVGRALTAMLVARARRRRLVTMTATILAGNRAAQRLAIGALGHPSSVEQDGPEVRFAFRLTT